MRIARVGLIGMALTASALLAPAWGQAASDGDDPLAACASIASRSARLSCYDNAERRRNPPPAREATAQPAPAARPRPAAARAPSAVARGFGAEQVRDRRPKSQRPKEITSTTATLAAASDNGVGHWRFTLSDGAVWQMTQADPYFIPPKAGASVRVRRGSLGGYLLDAGRQASVMVTRIR